MERIFVNRSQVGLPGRGKTFLCNKLKCYLNWLGHETKHFNVGMYRRQEKGQGELQDANFFDHTNREASPGVPLFPGTNMYIATLPKHWIAALFR